MMPIRIRLVCLHFAVVLELVLLSFHLILMNFAVKVLRVFIQLTLVFARHCSHSRFPSGDLGCMITLEAGKLVLIGLAARVCRIAQLLHCLFVSYAV